MKAKAVNATAFSRMPREGYAETAFYATGVTIRNRMTDATRPVKVRQEPRKYGTRLQKNLDMEL